MPRSKDENAALAAKVRRAMMRKIKDSHGNWKWGASASARELEEAGPALDALLAETERPTSENEVLVQIYGRVVWLLEESLAEAKKDLDRFGLRLARERSKSEVTQKEDT